MTQEDENKQEQTSIPFVNLHNLTTYSIFGSLIKVEDLFRRAKELGQTSISISDVASLAGIWDGLKESRKHKIKLIVGCTFYFVDDVNNKTDRIRTLVLLAKNAIGYRNLLLLSKFGFDNHIISRKNVLPRIDWKLLEQYHEGLICLTGDSSGVISRLINDKNINEAEKQAQKLKDIFQDDLAFELMPNALRRIINNFNENTDQAFTNRKLKQIGEKLNIKMVAAVGSRYVTPDQFDALDTFGSIGAGQPKYSNNRLRFNVNDFYIKSGNEVKTFFTRLFNEEFADELIANTFYFADKCEQPDWVDPKYSNKSGKELPGFPVKDQKDYQVFLKWKENYSENTLAEDVLYLRYKCELGLVSRNISEDKLEQYKDRIKEELDVLEYHGFSSYMLIVADFLEWARDNDIAVGPGRGSVGGCLVGYLINIHQADSIKYNLIFARFHNKEKTSYPDIDSDFSPSGREKVQSYIRNKYGTDYVAHVSNIITMKPKVYARAISRVYEYGGDRKTAVQVGTVLADTIPNGVNKISEALKDKAPLFAEYAKHYKELSEFANIFDGKPIFRGTHAAGLVVGKRPLPGLVPLRCDKDGQVALEFEKERAEENGLIKIDTLGLETLDIITETYKLIKKAGKTVPGKIDYDVYDEKTYNLLSAGKTFGVFQLGTSGGTIELCKKIKPKNLLDLAIINSLARPSAKEIRSDYIKTRNGDLEVKLIHPSLERAFGLTLGFGLFEECLMYLAQDVAGWSLHSADRLRKMTKDKGKSSEKAKKWREEFIDGAEKTGVGKEIATKIWDEVVDLFQGYGFNISHAIFYSMMGYETAYLKAHFPVEFLVANLKSEVTSNAKIAKDNIAKLKSEIKEHNVKILPPDINVSEMTYTIVDENTIRSSLNSLKYIGSSSIPEILARRAEKPFDSFEDFLTRCNSGAVRSNTVQALAASGSLDSFGMTRKQMYLYASDYKKKLQSYLKKKPEKRGEFKYPWPNDEAEWTIPEIHALEIYYLNEGLTGSPYDVYYPFFNKKAISFKDFPKLLPSPRDDMDEFELKKYNRKVPDIQGIVKNIFEFKIKKIDSKLFGETMAKMTVEDIFGSMITVTLFPDDLINFHDRIAERSNKKLKFEIGMGIKIVGTISYYDGNLGIIYEKLQDLCAAPKIPDKVALSHKKVSMIGKKSDKLEKVDLSKDEIDRNDLLDEIENELIDNGMSDLNDDYEE